MSAANASGDQGAAEDLRCPWCSAPATPPQGGRIETHRPDGQVIVEEIPERGPICSKNPHHERDTVLPNDAAERLQRLSSNLLKYPDALIAENAIELLGIAGNLLAYVCSVAAAARRDRDLYWDVMRFSLETRAASASKGRVYFIESTETGLIKIGYSTYPRGRMSALQTAHGKPLRLLHTMPGTKADEHKLHRRFAQARAEGEWFRPTTALLAFISELRAEPALDPQKRLSPPVLQTPAGS